MCLVAPSNFLSTRAATANVTDYLPAGAESSRPDSPGAYDTSMSEGIGEVLIKGAAGAAIKTRLG